MKKLKILLLTDTMNIGGAQTHILSLYRSLTEAGHTVIIASCGGELSKNINHKQINIASHSPITLFLSFFSLLSFIKQEKFDILHAHARIPALLAHLISHLCSIPFVCTAHARFKVDKIRKKLSFWGDKTIAVSEDLRLYLTKNYQISPQNIAVIENGLDTSRFPSCACDDPYHILFLSRLDSDCSLCASLLCELAPTLRARYPKLKITIGGGGDDYSRILALANDANRIIGKKTVFLAGKIKDVPTFLSQGGVFVGVSRTAIEATSCALPTIIGGNEGFLGHLTLKNYDFAKATNFCARTSNKASAFCLFSSLCSILDNYSSALDQAKTLRQKVICDLDLRALLPFVESFYLSAIDAYKAKKEKDPQTLLFGYYGYSNLGDDALLCASISRAKKEFGDSIGAFCHKPKKAKHDFCIPCFSRKNPFSLIFRIFRCKRLIFGGGTLLQNVTSTRSLIFYITILRLAQNLGKETLLFGNGIGEIKQKRIKKLLLSTLFRCSYIGLRDVNSYNFLRRALPNHANIHLESDLALSLPPASASRAHFLINSKLKEKSNSFFTVAVHFRATAYERFLLEQKIRALKLQGLYPLFIISSPKDIYPSYSLKKKFGGALICDLTFSDLLQILRFSRLTLSMRYHPLLASKAVSSPFVAIGSDSKLSEFKN